MKISKKTVRFLLPHIALTLLGGALGLVFHFAMHAEFMPDLDMRSYDFFYRLRGARPPNPAIQIIGVDEATLDQFGTGWPIPLPTFTRLLDELAQDPNSLPRVVAFDFHMHAEYGSREDFERLAKSANAFENVVWGRERIVGHPSKLETIPFVLEGANQRIWSGLVLSQPEAHPSLRFSRQAFVRDHIQDREVTGFALAVANAYKGRDLFQDGVVQNLFLINFTGPSGTYPIYSLSEVLERPDHFRGVFADRIVLIGRTDRFTPENFQRTPFYDPSELMDMSRVEIQANIISNILDHSSIRRFSEEFTLVGTVLAGAYTTWLVMILTPLTSTLLVFGVAILVALVSYALFVSHGLFLCTLPIVLCAFFCYYIAVPFRLSLEYRQKFKLREKNRLLQQIEELKGNFLSLISHDLKTPIVRVQGMAEAALKSQSEKLNDPNFNRTTYRKILDSSEELLNFVTKILDLAKMQSRSIQLNLQTHDLNELVQACCQQVRGFAEERGQAVECENEPLFLIKFDEALIRQVLLNLMYNAIKYNQGGEKIRVTTRSEGDQVRVGIQDWGIGIPEDELPHIFDRFYRVRNDLNTKLRGSGLGLYLARYFINLHGGEIEVQSELGQGTLFEFTLPVKPS